MNRKERWVVASLLLMIAGLAGVDVVNDYLEGVIWWHLGIEGLVVIASLSISYFLLKGYVKLRHNLSREKENSAHWESEANAWRQRSRIYLEGLSQEIERQLETWSLTEAEKEVAFLLLKGFSLNEIAEIRQTTAKTARQQAASIYAKSGLAGRSQLSAFFLEDLFLPKTMGN